MTRGRFDALNKAVNDFSPAVHPERMPEISRGLRESASDTPGKGFENTTTPAGVAEFVRRN